MYNKNKHKQKPMANKKYSGEEKVKFQERLAKIDDLIPKKDFVKQVLKVDGNLQTNRIENVRYGRTIDFYILGILEDICQPIQEKLLK